MADEKAIAIDEAESGAQLETPATTSDSTVNPRDWKNWKYWKSMGMVALKWMRANLLLALTLIAVIIGVFFGSVLRKAELTENVIKAIGLPGDILVRLLKLLVLPLIVSSLITGLTSLDTRSCGKLGARALVYYFTTSCIAVFIGIIVVVAIRPGKPKFLDEHGIDLDERSDSANPLDSLIGILRNLFPSNLVQACFQQAKSSSEEKTVEKYEAINETYRSVCRLKNASESSFCSSKNVTVIARTEGYSNNMNVLGILVFTIPFGVLLSRMGERGHVMVEFFRILSELTMELVNITMWYSPLGIMSLICAKVLGMGDLSEIVPILGLYMLTVVMGLLIHLAVLMTIFYASTRKNPLTFFEGILQAWLTAFATASSSATLPVTFRCLEENLKVDKRVTRFVLPIGATVNMDGTALYEAVATIFIGQLYGKPMGFVKLVTISLTATLGSIGAASIPSAVLSPSF
eukprot:XP_011672733.1 PREDICTED: excitatory amino acid transporter 2-like [Strongylocentrotus purpuratus]